MHVDLRGREADAFCGIHRLEHVVDKLPDRGVDGRYRYRFGTQSRVWILQYGELRHSFENAAKVKPRLKFTVNNTGLGYPSPCSGVARLRRGPQPPMGDPDYKAVVATPIPDGERDGS